MSSEPDGFQHYKETLEKRRRRNVWIHNGKSARSINVQGLANPELFGINENRLAESNIIMHEAAVMHFKPKEVK